MLQCQSKPLKDPDYSLVSIKKLESKMARWDGVQSQVTSVKNPKTSPIMT